MALRWRKQPNETGLRRVCQGPRGFELREGSTIVIRVSPLLSNHREVMGWYWYGLGKNTSNEPTKTAEEAKAQGMAWAKERAV